MLIEESYISNSMSADGQKIKHDEAEKKAMETNKTIDPGILWTPPTRL